VPDLSVSEVAMAEMEKALTTSATTLGNMDQATRHLDTAVVGADPLIQHLVDLHETLASTIQMLGKALTTASNFVGTASATFGETDRKLAIGHEVAAQ